MSWYVALDGDGVGDHLERCILEEDEGGAHELSLAVNKLIRELTQLLEAWGGRVLISGGDSVLARFDASPDSQLLRVLAATDDPVTISAGIGTSMRHAWMALKYAKSMKPAVVRYHEGTFERVRGRP